MLKQSFLRLASLNLWLGKAVSWLTLTMVLGTFAIVLLRYGFNLNSIQVQESVIYMHGMVFMLGAAYTYAQNEHVRVDIFYQKFSERTRLVVDMVGILLLLLPVMLFIWVMCFRYVESSWAIKEVSNETGGLPYLYLLKSLLLAMPALMIYQGVVEFISKLGLLLKWWQFAELPNSQHDKDAEAHP